jgi:hypothetical protein
MTWRRDAQPGPALAFLSTTLLGTILMLVVFCEGPESVLAVASHQNPARELEFSAKVTWRSDGEARDALLFVKGDRYRIEHRGGVRTDLGYAGVSIVREDQNEVWYVLSQRRSYLALPLAPVHMLPLAVKLEGEIDRTLVGDAMTGGRAAQLYEVVVERYGRREAYFEWVDAEHGLLLKLLSKHRDWSVEYQHVVVSEQPSYYFEVPRGYKRIEAHEKQE